ncbi:sorting nexin [Anaeramoeba ignava]|uniref:Sorting nexin n=1 Tax=Anaeramoeba ignava TaxID=1746090 RepID=A0A9Q0RH56_ANAIG|nr:sorting nexin [Anaeramoeba ignava]
MFESKISFEVVAIADYEPQDERELGFKKNDKITILDDNYNWWVGYIDKTQPGLIPKNYITIELSQDEKPKDSQDSQEIDEETQLKNLPNLQEKNEKKHLKLPPKPKTKPPPLQRPNQPLKPPIPTGPKPTLNDKAKPPIPPKSRKPKPPIPTGPKPRIPVQGENKEIQSQEVKITPPKPKFVGEDLTKVMEPQKNQQIQQIQTETEPPRYFLDDKFVWNLREKITPFTFTISLSPNNKNMKSGKSEKTKFLIVSNTQTLSVEKSFIQFREFRDQLADQYKSCAIPQILPAKKITSPETFLSQFLDRISRHPILGTSSLYKEFIGLENEIKETNLAEFGFENEYETNMKSTNTTQKISIEKFSIFLQTLENQFSQLRLGFNSQSVKYKELSTVFSDLGNKVTELSRFQFDWRQKETLDKNSIDTITAIASSLVGLSSTLYKNFRLYETNPKIPNDLLSDFLNEYSVLISSFEEIWKRKIKIKAQKDLVQQTYQKLQTSSSHNFQKITTESEKLEKITNLDSKFELAILAEMEHFRYSLCQDFKIAFQRYVNSQIQIQEKVTEFWKDMLSLVKSIEVKQGSSIESKHLD